MNKFHSYFIVIAQQVKDLHINTTHWNKTLRYRLHYSCLILNNCFISMEHCHYCYFINTHCLNYLLHIDDQIESSYSTTMMMFKHFLLITGQHSIHLIAVSQ